jgi:hypothetical protein
MVGRLSRISLPFTAPAPRTPDVGRLLVNEGNIIADNATIVTQPNTILCLFEFPGSPQILSSEQLLSHHGRFADIE